MAKNRVITVQGIPVTVSYEDIDDYICITDIAAAKSDNSRAADVIRNWLRNRSTLEFLSTWEEIYNPNFKVFESEHFKKEAGLVTFTPSVSEWVEKTNAVGLYVKRGKYGGTFAHKDIAFEFASAIIQSYKSRIFIRSILIPERNNFFHCIIRHIVIRIDTSIQLCMNISICCIMCSVHSLIILVNIADWYLIFLYPTFYQFFRMVGRSIIYNQPLKILTSLST